MVVSILPECVDGDLDLLNRLFYAIQDGHELFVKRNEVDIFRDSEWYFYATEMMKKVIDQYIELSLNRHEADISFFVGIDSNDGNVYSIQEAINYLKEPLQIILENSQNDSAFIECIIKHNKKRSKKLKAHIEHRRARYTMGGGTSIQQVINTIIASFNTPNFTKKPMSYLRCFVILDSDRSHPTMPFSEEKRRLADYLSELGVPYHVFEKREMENYLPEEVYAEFQDNRRYIDAFLRLNPLQKDFFDIQHGFEDKDLHSFPEGVQKLYAKVDAADIAIFRKNNLSQSKLFNGESFKTGFPKLFSSELINRENLNQRCNHKDSEMSEHIILIDKITKCL